MTAGPVGTRCRCRLVGVLALAGLFGALGACREGAGEPNRVPAPSTTTRAVANGDVTLTGEVTRSFGQFVVQLGSVPAEPVLVVFSTPNAFPVGARLEVTGRVRTFTRPTLEAELGVDLGGDVDGLTGRECLVVRQVRRL